MSAADDVLRRFVAQVDRERLGAYGVHVLVGDSEAQHRWRSDDRVNTYSVSKGVCALAAGIAIGEGVIGASTTVAEALPELVLGAGVERVTLLHLLTMRSGIDFRWFGSEPVPYPDLAGEMLRRPTRGPGEPFQYSDASTYTAMRMLAARVGDVRDWLMPRLFDPLQIHNPQWQRDPRGFIVGGSGLELRTEELARIGRLLRDRGQWRGRPVVPAAWIDGMHGGWRTTGSDGPYAEYGVAAWRGPGDAWRLDGLYGQYVVVDDARDAVVTVTAHEEFREHRLAESAAEAMRSIPS